IKDLEIELDEYSKYKLVDNFYKSIPSDGKYLSDFYETLKILDSGYMSERKSEAQRIFREIYDVSVIPVSPRKFEDEIKEIAKDIQQLFSQDCNFKKFKSDFLSKKVVSLPLRSVREYLTEERKAFSRIEKYIKTLIEGKKSKLRRWLEGIYILKIDYDENKGIVLDKEKLKEYESEENILL
ncbi:MAG: hypothetical protein ACPLZ9_05070, partial [Candidatus Ratteibacteria bacterium]